MADVPAEAVAAAAAILTEAMTVTGTTPTAGQLAADAGLAELMLEAAAPAIRAAERERLADRSRTITAVKGELDDAFQFTEHDGSHHSYVTRAWVESLLAVHAASAALAEREKIRQLAIEQKAFVPKPCPSPVGDEDCGCQDLPFADLIGGQP